MAIAGAEIIKGKGFTGAEQEMGRATTYPDTGENGALIATYNYQETNGRRTIPVVVATFRGVPTDQQVKEVEGNFPGTPVRVDPINPQELNIMLGGKG